MALWRKIKKRHYFSKTPYSTANSNLQNKIGENIQITHLDLWQKCFLQNKYLFQGSNSVSFIIFRWILHFRDLKFLLCITLEMQVAYFMLIEYWRVNKHNGAIAKGFMHGVTELNCLECFGYDMWTYFSKAIIWGSILSYFVPIKYMYVKFEDMISVYCFL